MVTRFRQVFRRRQSGPRGVQLEPFAVIVPDEFDNDVALRESALARALPECDVATWIRADVGL